MRVLVLAAFVALAGCASTGLEGLERNATHAERVVDRPYAALAACVASELDRQPGGLGTSAILPNVWRHQEDRQLIEVANIGHRAGPFTDPSRMAYRLLFQGEGDGRTVVSISARNNVHPLLGRSYALDLVEGALTACS